MTEAKTELRNVEETPVDDVRRVRTKLSRETGNDVNRLADLARKVADDLREKLGLKRVQR